MSGLPVLPAGRNLIGQAYRIVASPGAILPDGSVSIQYLQNDLTIAGVIDSDLEMYYYDGSTWLALGSTVDDYYNILSAPSEGAGVYALFASIRVLSGGCSLEDLAYPLRDSHDIGEALTSIDGKYSLVYGYEGTEPTSPGVCLIPTMACFQWVNTFAELKFGQGYWIYAHTGTTMYFGSPPLVSPEVSWLPTTFYGQLDQLAGQTPTAGMPVAIWQDGELKGEGLTQEQAGRIVYALQVMVDESAGPVTIQITTSLVPDR